nr:glycosyltransferase [Haladaptatus sp. DYSN1]
MNPVQVSYVIESLAAGGAERMLLRQIRHSPRNPTVYTFGGAMDLKEEYRKEGARIVNLSKGSGGSWSLLYRLRQQLNAEEPDIVHSHLPTAHVLSRLATRSTDVKAVVSTHHSISNNFLDQSKAEKFEIITRPLSSVNIAISRAVKHSRKLSCFPTNWKILYHGIDVGNFNKNVIQGRNDNRTRDYPVFLNVGRYIDEKSQKDIIKAMPKVLEEFKNATAIIVGWGELEDDLRELSNDVGVSENVQITGKSLDIHTHYANADVFVMSSLNEGFGIVLLEAMAARLPIVGTNTSSIPEIVNSEFGILVPPNSANDLADAMISMAKSDTWLKGKKAHQFARDRFSIERMVEKHEEVYRIVYNSART